jgi:organic radical activating enzyme
MKYLIRNKYSGKILTNPISNYFKAEKIMKKLNSSSDAFEIVTSKQLAGENPPTASKKDTLRLIITLDCNLSCSYCCNNLPEIKSRFVEKELPEIDFTQYKNICITGGEPFLDKPRLYNLLLHIPRGINVFIYTNGLLVQDTDIEILKNYWRKVKCLNIGLHTVQQAEIVFDKPWIQDYPVRLSFQDIKRKMFEDIFPDVFTLINSKSWSMNKCEAPNEDWVLLKNFDWTKRYATGKEPGAGHNQVRANNLPAGQASDSPQREKK